MVSNLGYINEDTSHAEADRDKKVDRLSRSLRELEDMAGTIRLGLNQIGDVRAAAADAHEDDGEVASKIAVIEEDFLKGEISVQAAVEVISDRIRYLKELEFTYH